MYSCLTRPNIIKYNFPLLKLSFLKPIGSEVQSTKRRTEVYPRTILLLLSCLLPFQPAFALVAQENPALRGNEQVVARIHLHFDLQDSLWHPEREVKVIKSPLGEES